MGEYFERQVHATSWVGGSLLGQWFHCQKADLKINPTLGYAGGYVKIFPAHGWLYEVILKGIQVPSATTTVYPLTRSFVLCLTLSQGLLCCITSIDISRLAAQKGVVALVAVL